MAENQTKNDKKDSMFIKLWSVCHWSLARNNSTRTKRAVLRERREEVEEEDQGEKRERDQQGDQVKQKAMEEEELCACERETDRGMLTFIKTVN